MYKKPFPFFGWGKKQAGGKVQISRGFFRGFSRSLNLNPIINTTWARFFTFLGLGGRATQIAGNLSTQFLQDCHCTCLRQAGMILVTGGLQTQRGGVATVWWWFWCFFCRDEFFGLLGWKSRIRWGSLSWRMLNAHLRTISHPFPSKNEICIFSPTSVSVYPETSMPLAWVLQFYVKTSKHTTLVGFPKFPSESESLRWSVTSNLR